MRSRRNRSLCARKIVRGIYSGDLTAAAEDLVRRHLSKIVAYGFPGAVFVDRSVPAGGLPVDGNLFVDRTRQRPVQLPGITIWPRKGPGLR